MRITIDIKTKMRLTPPENRTAFTNTVFFFITVLLISLLFHWWLPIVLAFAYFVGWASCFHGIMSRRVGEIEPSHKEKLE